MFLLNPRTNIYKYRENNVSMDLKMVQIDNEMRQLRNELNNRKKLKDDISSTLLSLMKQNNIDTFDLNDGKIEYATRKTKKPISKKMLLNILSKYYNGDPKKTNELNQFILENREENVKEIITRKLDS